MKDVISEAISTIKHWWLLLILGVLLLGGGIWIAFSPREGFLALAIVFIVLLLVNGIFQIIFSISNSNKMSGWGWHLAGGILEFLIGIYLWSYPGISLIMLTFVVGFWLLFRGIFVIAGSTDLKDKGLKGWGWILTLGIVMTILSFFIIMDPVFGAFSVVYLTAFAMIFMGIAYIVISFKLKKIKSETIDKVSGDLDDLKKSVMNYVNELDPDKKEKITKLFEEFKKH